MPLQNRSDVELMARVGAGDRNAQRLLVVRLLRRVERLTRALTRNHDSAKDAGQDSMIAILRAAGSYRGDSSLERWADRIVIRITLRLARNRRRHPTELLEDGNAPSVRAIADPKVAAGEYMALLTDAQSSALVLRCGFGYSVEEIAELTETSPNTIKDRLKRARECVRAVARGPSATTDSVAAESAE